MAFLPWFELSFSLSLFLSFSLSLFLSYLFRSDAVPLIQFDQMQWAVAHITSHHTIIHA